ELIEGHAVPAFVLRTGPGVYESDARRSQFVHGDAGDGRRGVSHDAERASLRVQPRPQIGRVAFGADDEGAGIEVAVVGFEAVFGGEHFHVFEFETEGGQDVVGVVIDQVGGGRGGARDSARRFGVGIEQRHGRLKDGGVGDTRGDGVHQRTHRPAGVVVWRRVADVVVLRVEQHVGHAAVRLIHADYVAAGGQPHLPY